MSSSPAGDVAGQRRPPSLTAWLRRRDDAALTRLLALRPDLALPAPPDLATLAARIGVRTSVQRAIDALDAPALRALETLVLTAGDDDAVDAPDARGLDALFDRALIWGDPDLIHLAPTVRDALGPYPAGLGRSAALLFRQVPDVQLAPVLRTLGLPPATQPGAGAAVTEIVTDPGRRADLLAGLDAEERAILDRLAAGPPVGAVRGTTAPAEGPSAAHRLILRGLLVPIDTLRVELPREIGLDVRDAAGAANPAEPPDVPLVARGPGELDRFGTTAVAELLRLVDALADAWTAQPPPVLRTGGIGVRELKRTAKALDVDEPTAALVAEVALAAGLINSTDGIEPVYLPSEDYDGWVARDTARRWMSLATAWLTMTRQPGLVGQRGERDRVIAALGPDAERGTAPALRRHVLHTLAAFPPGSAPARRDDVLALLAWQQPRRAAGQRPTVQAMLDEADRLGVTAAGGVTGWTRTLLADAARGPAAEGAAAAAEHALAHALPAPVDHFLVQPDLTVVVPGPPERHLAAELAVVADLESSGGAQVYRITERSVRRAFDAGRSAAALTAFVTDHSRTPLPQALTYLIDDAARRHGVLRAGAASAYLRCDDAALLARVLADRSVAALGLRALAPTVAVADAPINRVLDGLRDAGFAPAAESSDGALVSLDVERPRAPSRPAARPAAARSDAGARRLPDLVRRMRIGDEALTRGARTHPVAQAVPGVTSAATMELLRRAVREERAVQLGVAEPDGATVAHTLVPISLAAGSVRGYESGRSGLTSYPVHRVTSIVLLDPGDAELFDDGPDAS